MSINTPVNWCLINTNHHKSLINWVYDSSVTKAQLLQEVTGNTMSLIKIYNQEQVGNPVFTLNIQKDWSEFTGAV